ncbi:MAG: hypothetical protein R2911_21515 [Caldilineaceae bacterium]
MRAEAQHAIAATAGRRFILSAGCVTPIVAPTGNIAAARRAGYEWLSLACQRKGGGC